MLLTTLRKCRWLMPPMALLLVASTSVPSLWRMYCPEMARSRTAWVEIEACCHPDEQNEASEVRTHCCDYSVVQADLSTFEQSKGARFSGPAFVSEAWAFHQAASGTMFGMEVCSLLFERPPPRTSAERSALLRVLRV